MATVEINIPIFERNLKLFNNERQDTFPWG